MSSLNVECHRRSNLGFILGITLCVGLSLLTVGCGTSGGHSVESQTASPSASDSKTSLAPLGSEAEPGPDDTYRDGSGNALPAVTSQQPSTSLTTETTEVESTPSTDTNDGSMMQDTSPAAMLIVDALSVWPYGPVTGVPPSYSDDIVSSVVGLSGQAAIDDMLTDGAFLYSLEASLANVSCRDTGVVDEVANGVVVDCSAQYNDAVMNAFGVEPQWISASYSVKDDQIVRILSFNDAVLPFGSYFEGYLINQGAEAHKSACESDRRSQPCAKTLIQLAHEAAPGWQP